MKRSQTNSFLLVNMENLHAEQSKMVHLKRLYLQVNRTWTPPKVDNYEWETQDFIWKLSFQFSARSWENMVDAMNAAPVVDGKFVNLI